MLKITSIISLPVINMYELKIEGYIEKAYINNKKCLEKLLVYDDKNDTYKVVKYCNIHRISNDAIFITNSSKITLFENEELSLQSLVYPVNAQCYNLDGTNLGVLQDISLNKNRLVSFKINENSYPIGNVAGFSNEVILICTSKKISVNSFKPQIKHINTLKSVNPEPVVAILNTSEQDYKNTNFLIGRTILKDIKSLNGEILAKKNIRITQSIVSKLKAYGKLKELTINSR